jgi:hypothetical protein
MKKAIYKGKGNNKKEENPDSKISVVLVPNIL